MEDRFPLTSDQREQLRLDLAEFKARSAEIAGMLTACYGTTSQATSRAEELDAAVQRLQWELERNGAFAHNA